MDLMTQPTASKHWRK